MKKTIKLLTLLFTAALATGCGGGNGGGGGETSQGGGGGSPDYFEFEQSLLDTPQEIHTADQKAYLSYNKGYYNITSQELNDFNATGNGQMTEWRPKQVTLKWDYEPPDGATVSKYVLTFGQKPDLSDGYSVDGTSAKTISFYNAFLGTNYFRITAKFTDGEQEESEIRTFQVEEECPRNLSVGNMPNCRDMGGRTTYAGGKIKQGLIYRTSGSGFASGQTPNDEAKDIFLNQMRVKTEINVADGTGNNVNLNGVKVENCFMAYGAVPYSNLARNSVRIRQVMNVLADENNYPLFYHCRIGTDRTGITGVMVGGLIGIEFNEILQDYGFSNFSPIDGQRYPHKSNDNNGDDIAKYIDAINELPGETFQEKVYLALRLIGCPAAQLDKIIDILTIGKKATIPATAKIGADSDLTSSVSKTTASDYKTPASYYTVPASGKVSFTTETTAGDKDVILYLGYTGSVTNGDTTSRLSNNLTLKIDGEEKTITSSKSLWTAGFGSTQQDNRIGYMFNILGNYAFTAGSHTIEIGVKEGSSSFNIATIGVADHASA